MQENDLQKIFKKFCYAVTIFLVNIMLRILVYFTNRKKLIYVIFFVAIALSVIHYLFSLQNNNGKLDFCLDDVVFSSQHLKDIKCSILESQAKLYIPSTLNIDLKLWHIQLIVCAVKC